MISHEYRCIFIHIPRTGGSSIEKALVGRNWWSISKETKHITASQAREVYGDYWGKYFKFSFVRNPWDRCVSLLAFSSFYYGLSSGEKKSIGSKLLAYELDDSIRMLRYFYNDLYNLEDCFWKAVHDIEPTHSFVPY